MGKGIIKGGGEEGKYQVEVVMNRDWVDGQISKLEANITAFTTKLLVVKGFLARKVIELQIKSCEKKIELLNTTCPVDETVSAWCADLTENITGVVSTIEVPGESTNIQIRPGYEGGSSYEKGRDGQLTQTMGQPASGFFYNLAMLPGWQKWKPLFRYASIDSIDSENNEADLTLSGEKSSQQNLDINQATTISGVPIEYMDCNSAAFEAGDEVLLMFSGNDWSAPKVIGFKENPKPCFSGFYIRPTFNGHYAAYGEEVININYTYDGVDYHDSKKVFKGAGNVLSSYTETLFEVPKEVLENKTEITIQYSLSDGKTASYYEVVGQDDDYTTILHYGVDSPVYLKRINEKEAVAKLTPVPAGTVTTDKGVFDYYDAEFEDLKVLRRRPTIAYYTKTDVDEIIYVDDHTFPNCIVNVSPETKSSLVNEKYVSDFLGIYASPYKCPDNSKVNVYGEYPDQYAISSSFENVLEDFRTQGVECMAITTDEYGNNPIFNDWYKTILQNKDEYFCYVDEYTECREPPSYFSGYRYDLRWDYEMVNTPENWW